MQIVIWELSQSKIHQYTDKYIDVECRYAALDRCLCELPLYLTFSYLHTAAGDRAVVSFLVISSFVF